MLRESDYKLLTYLYHSHRESATTIARAMHLSREQVDYRIKKYLSLGIIKEFFTVFDYAKVGYNCFVTLFLKFEAFSSFESFSKKLMKQKNCVSWGRMLGKYDLYLNTIFKNEEELSQFIAELLNDVESPIADYLLMKPIIAELYPLKLFKSLQRESFSLVSKEPERRFDKQELALMKILATDGRARLVDIAEKLKISRELAFYKLKKLKKDNVILGSRIQFDMRKLGYHATIVVLTIQKLSTKIQHKIREYARQSKGVNSFMIALTKPNCMIQFFHKNEGELRDSIIDLRSILMEDDISMDLVLAETEETVINPLPFL